MGSYNGPMASHTVWTYAAPTAGITNTATAVTIKAATTGQHNYITDIQVSHATLGAATELAIRDGAAGTVLWRMTLGTVANENLLVHFRTPLRGSIATLLEVVTLTAVTGAVLVNVQGYSSGV